MTIVERFISMMTYLPPFWFRIHFFRSEKETHTAIRMGHHKTWYHTYALLNVYSKCLLAFFAYFSFRFEVCSLCVTFFLSQALVSERNGFDWRSFDIFNDRIESLDGNKIGKWSSKNKHFSRLTEKYTCNCGICWLCVRLQMLW